MKKSTKKALTCVFALALLLSPVISSSTSTNINTSGNNNYQINTIFDEMLVC
jgi:hypothetical protein